MRFRPMLTMAVAVAALMLLTGCGTDPDASPSEGTTGTVAPDETTTTLMPSTTAPEGAGDLVGLWLATPAGIENEAGDVYATPGTGETLVSPLDDGSGAVLYLRCGETLGQCSIERSVERNGTPQVIGEAQRLLGVGTLNDRPVLLTSWSDPAITPSFEGNVSGLVARAIDLETNAVLATYPWYGWESGPFAADVEQDRFAVCSGEGETCALTMFVDVDAPPEPVPGVDFSTVTSLALDAEATTLTWVASTPMSGALVARSLDVESGVITDTELRVAVDPPSDESVTDGAWVAIRLGETVELRELAGDLREGELTVPTGTTEIAIRVAGGSAGVVSSL